MNRFAFLLHPLSLKDVVRYAPGAAGKREELIKKVLHWMPPYEVSQITGVKGFAGKTTQGNFCMVPLLPDQFIQLPRQEVLDQVIKAAKIAQNLGAKIVGLGGYNSVVGQAGLEIAQAVDIAVTSGNSYTVATAIEGALKAAQVMDLDLEKANVAVIGATGSIGSVSSRLLARQARRLTLVARSKSRLQVLAETIRKESRVALAIEMDIARGIQEADMVITATSSGGNIIRPEYFKPGAIVCDVAVPHDVCREVAKERPDVFVIEGGVVEVPGEVDFGFDFGFPPKMALACMAETMILALEERWENFSLGRKLDFKAVDTILKLAQKHGFKLAGFRSFDEPVLQEDIEKIKQAKKELRKLKTISLEP